MQNKFDILRKPIEFAFTKRKFANSAEKHNSTNFANSAKHNSANLEATHDSANASKCAN